MERARTKTAVNVTNPRRDKGATRRYSSAREKPAASSAPTASRPGAKPKKAICASLRRSNTSSVWSTLYSSQAASARMTAARRLRNGLSADEKLKVVMVYTSCVPGRRLYHAGGLTSRPRKSTLPVRRSWIRNRKG